MTDPPSDQAIENSIATVVDGIERFIAADRRDEAAALLEELLPFLTEGLEFTRNIERIGLYSGLALACLRLKRAAEAHNYAGRALITDPRDLLAHALLPTDARIAIARQLIHHRRHDLARALLETVDATGQPGDSSFYLELLDFYEAQKRAAQALPPLSGKSGAAGGRATLLNLVVWGPAYVEKCLRSALPSLLAPGNIPALAARGPLVLDIHTRASDRATLEGGAALQAVREHAEIRFSILPESLLDHTKSDATPDPDRWCVAGAQYTGAIAARRLGADLGFVGVDNVYSGDYLSRAKGFLAAGSGAVVTTAIRAEEAPMAARLAAHRTGAAIAVDAATLLAHAVATLNRQIFDGFIRSAPTTVAQDPVSLFFRSADGFASHTFQLNPAMIAADLLPDDFTYDFHTLDARFLAEISAGCDLDATFKVVERADRDLVVIDLDAGVDGAARAFGTFPVTVEACAKAGLKWCDRESDLDYFEWAFGRRFTVPCGAHAATLPQSELDEAQTVAAVRERFRAGAAETVRRIRLYSGDS